MRRWLVDEKSKAILIAAIIEMKQLVDTAWRVGDDEYGDAQYQELRRLGEKLRKEIDGDTNRNRG